MGLFLTFYVAVPEEFIILCKQMASTQTVEEALSVQEQFACYPQTDFSLNLTIPDHTDALCQAMIAEGLAIPSSSLDLFGEPIWDGEASSIHQLPDTFVLALAQVDEVDVKRIAEEWVNSLLPAKREANERAIVLQNALGALSDLCAAAAFALEYHRSLLLRFGW